jgi:hypothetical protein
MNAVQIASNILILFYWLSYIIIGLATVAFLWGTFKYGLSKSSSEKEKAKNFIINGLIIIFVMVSLWGIVRLISYTFNIGQTTLPRPANINSSGLIKR